MVTLYPDIDFVAKTQSLDDLAEPIKLKVFTSVGGADIDRKLCPVRSLLQYRKATAAPECRKGRKKLFISYKPSKSDDIKRATTSSWICKLMSQKAPILALWSCIRCRHTRFALCQLPPACSEA